jgi:hypothetical protein
MKILLTGHCHVKDHLLKLAITDSPIYGRCHMATKSASHIFCECVALDELIFSSLGKHFMERSDYYEIVLRKILHFVRGTGLLAEYRIWGCTDQDIVAVQGSRTPHFYPITLILQEKKSLVYAMFWGERNYHVIEEKPVYACLIKLSWYFQFCCS